MLVNKCLYYTQTHITNIIQHGDQKLFLWEFQTEAQNFNFYVT